MKRLLWLLLVLGGCGEAFATAPTVIQCTTQQGGASVASQAATFSSTPTVGNHVIVAVTYGTNGGTEGISAASDNKGNTYQLDGEVAFNFASAGFVSAKITSSSAIFTVTVSFVTSNIDVYIAACEVHGLDPNKWLELISGDYSVGMDPALITQTQANASPGEDFIIAAAKTEGASVTGTPSTGYTDIIADPVGVFTGGRASYKIVSSPETSTASFPISTMANAHTVIATYKAAGAGGGGGGSTQHSLSLMGAGQ